jgi:putative redox protein
MGEQQSPHKARPLVELVWEHDLVFAGHSGGVGMTLDSASAAGPSPMQALAFALAGCMAMDVVHVITKGRYDLRGLRVDLSGTRAATDPRRFTAITLHYSVTGDVPGEKIDRAIELSREKYCSVWHSMRQDIDLSVTYSVTTGV